MTWLASIYCSIQRIHAVNDLKWNLSIFIILPPALMYCSLDTLSGKLRGGEEDEFNSVGAATLTGMIFKSTAGLRPIAIAGALGGGLATAYHFGEKLWNSRGHSISTPNWAWTLLIQFMLLWTRTTLNAFENKLPAPCNYLPKKQVQEERALFWSSGRIFRGFKGVMIKFSWKEWTRTLIKPAESLRTENVWSA